MASFREFTEYYDELFPRITPVSSKNVMETPTGEKDITEEVKEEFVDNPIVEEKEIETNGNSGTNDTINE